MKDLCRISMLESIKLIIYEENAKHKIHNHPLVQKIKNIWASGCGPRLRTAECPQRVSWASQRRGLCWVPQQDRSSALHWKDTLEYRSGCRNFWNLLSETLQALRLMLPLTEEKQVCSLEKGKSTQWSNYGGCSQPLLVSMKTCQDGTEFSTETCLHDKSASTCLQPADSHNWHLSYIIQRLLKKKDSI